MSRRKWVMAGCAVTVVLLVGVVLVVTPAAIALRLAGFRTEGRTEDLLDQQASVVPPTIEWAEQPDHSATAAALGDSESMQATSTDDGPPSGPVSLDQVMVDAWFLSQPTAVSVSDALGRVERGLSGDNELAYYFEFDEMGINTYLAAWFGEYLAQETRLRNIWLDLKPGGAILYADVNLEVGWQRVGAVLMLDASGRQLILAGVDIGGRLYSTPPDGQIASLAAQLEDESNRALRELAFVDPAGRLVVQRISLGDDSIQILAY